MNLEQLQKSIEFSPFHCWLGLQAKSIFDDGIEMILPWREEIVSNPTIQSTHGGILASVIDLSGLYAILVCGGSVSATTDLHVDYLRTAFPGELTIRSKIIKIGRKTSTASTEVFDANQKLLASGRGLYVSAS
ncbi:MAG: hypothetical protein ACI89U_003051 [Gammaproteobacteria bacterium]|jgi:uncharacterized protein (TIGR00369 family)